MGDSVQPRGPAAVTVRLEGHLDVTSAGPIYERLQRAASNRGVERVDIDFAHAGRIDSAGVAAVVLGRRALESAGKRVALSGLSDEQRAALEMGPPHPPEDRSAPAAPRPTTLERIGSRSRLAWTSLLELSELAVDLASRGLRCLAGRDRVPLGATAEQAARIGVDALPIVAMLSFLLGLVLGFQSVLQLARFGTEVFMAEVVALSMVREFGSLITAIILAGRSGAAMAAELGTMRINEEVDALRTMGISPLRFLVLPRLVAISIVQPLLSVLSMVIGIAGGLAITILLRMPWTGIFDRMIASLGPQDFWLGLIKSLLFAWVIGLAGCFMGMHARGGARSVGTAATGAVVSSIFFVIVIDSIVTSVWTVSHYE